MAASTQQGVAGEALAELRSVSPQIEAVLVATREGTPLAALVAGSDDAGSAGARRLGQLARKILDEADRSRSELGREPVVQCEVATGAGNVFVVADHRHAVLAVTGNEPTVGLVFYDLKTVLRTLREQDAGSAGGNGKAGS